MDVFEIDVKIQVPAASSEAAVAFVKACLAHEVRANSALVVMSVTHTGTLEGRS